MDVDRDRELLRQQWRDQIRETLETFVANTTNTNTILESYSPRNHFQDYMGSLDQNDQIDELLLERIIQEVNRAYENANVEEHDSHSDYEPPSIEQVISVNRRRRPYNRRNGIRNIDIRRIVREHMAQSAQSDRSEQSEQLEQSEQSGQVDPHSNLEDNNRRNELLRTWNRLNPSNTIPIPEGSLNSSNSSNSSNNSGARVVRANPSYDLFPINRSNVEIHQQNTVQYNQVMTDIDQLLNADEEDKQTDS